MLSPTSLEEVTPSPQATELSTVAWRTFSRWVAVRQRVWRVARSAGVVEYLDISCLEHYDLFKVGTLNFNLMF